MEINPTRTLSNASLLNEDDELYLNTSTSLNSSELAATTVINHMNISTSYVLITPGSQEITNRTYSSTVGPKTNTRSSNTSISKRVAMIGSTASMSCSHNNSQVTWQLKSLFHPTLVRVYNGYKLSKIDKYHVDVTVGLSTLSVFNVSREDAGSYTCTEAKPNSHRIVQLAVVCKRIIHCVCDAIKYCQQYRI